MRKSCLPSFPVEWGPDRRTDRLCERRLGRRHRAKAAFACLPACSLRLFSLPLVPEQGVAGLILLDSQCPNQICWTCSFVSMNANSSKDLKSFITSQFQVTSEIAIPPREKFEQNHLRHLVVSRSAVFPRPPPLSPSLSPFALLRSARGVGEEGGSAGCREAEAAARPTPTVRPSVQGRAKAEKEGEEREGLTVESKPARSLDGSAFLAKNQRRGLSALPTEQGQTTLTFCARARRPPPSPLLRLLYPPRAGGGCIEASRDGRKEPLFLLKGQDRRWPQ